MEFLTHKELHQRALVLKAWLDEHDKEHYYYEVVNAERQDYINMLEIMNMTGERIVEIQGFRQCYHMIKTATL